MPKDDVKKDDITIDDDLNFEELLTEAFVLSGYIRKFMQNKQSILKKLGNGNISTLMNINCGKFGHILTDFNISMNSAMKIYEIIQYNIQTHRDDINNINESELNSISINFNQVAYNQITFKYRISLNNIQIISSSLRNKTATIELHSNSIESCIDSQNKMLNPLVILIGISEYDGIGCCQQLIDIKYDMIALRKLFRIKYNYTVYHRNDRMYWRAKQVIDFCHYVIKDKLIHWRFGKLKEEFDAIIIYISAYYKHNYIITSDQHSINLSFLYQIFGEQYDQLLLIPRLFIINKYQINHIHYNINHINHIHHNSYSNNSNSNSKSSLKLRKHSSNRSNNSNYVNVASNSVVDNTQKRLTIFGCSYYGNRIISYSDKDNFENDGCSLFCKSFIIAMYKYHESNPYKRRYTPYLYKIVDDIQLNLNILLKKHVIINIDDFNDYNNLIMNQYNDFELQQPYVYKDGDIAFMNDIKLIKKGNNNNIDQKQNELHEFSINKKVLVYLYKDIITQQYMNMSRLSLSDINIKLINNCIEAQIPKEAIIRNIITLNNTTLYRININNINVRLRSIGGIDSTSFKHKCYGDIASIKANDNRYIQVVVRNESHKYILSLDISNNGSYLYQCDYLKQPVYISLSTNYEHSYCFIGLKHLNYNIKSGIIACVQYIIRNNKTGKDTDKRFVCAFNGIDSNNYTKDRDFPLIDCWILDKTQINLKELTAKLINDKPKKKKYIDCKSNEIHSAFFRFFF